MRHDFGEVTLHSAEAIPEWLTPENCPLCHFQQLKKEAFHSQDLGVYHSVHHKMYTCLLQKKKKSNFKKQFQVHSRIEKKVQRFPICSLTRHVGSLSHFQVPLPRWYICYKWRTSTDTSLSPIVHHLHQGLFVVLYILWDGQMSDAMGIWCDKGGGREVSCCLIFPWMCNL